MPKAPPERTKALHWWVRMQNQATILTDEEVEAIAARIPDDHVDNIVEEYRQLLEHGVSPVEGEPLIVLHQEVVLRENDNAREALTEYAGALHEAAEQLESVAEKLGKTFTVREAYDKGKLQRSKLTGVISAPDDTNE